MLRQNVSACSGMWREKSGRVGCRPQDRSKYARQCSNIPTRHKVTQSNPMSPIERVCESPLIGMILGTLAGDRSAVASRSHGSANRHLLCSGQ